MTELEWEVFRMDYHQEHGVLLPHADRAYYEGLQSQSSKKRSEIAVVPEKPNHPSAT